MISDLETPSLFEVLRDLGPHEHLCSIYESQEEQLAAAIPFLQIGIERGEKCAYIADQESGRAAHQALLRTGIDVDRITRSNTLLMMNPELSYLKAGDFEPGEMLTFWNEAAELARREGFSSFRAVGETAWLLNGHKAFDRWLEYESKVTDAVSKINCCFLCQYNRAFFSPEVILDIIHTHPIVVYRGMVCRNMYYAPASEFLGKNRAAKEVERCLANIREREQVEYTLRRQHKELQASERRFRLLVEGVKDYAIFWLDPLGRVTNWNKGAERLEGYREEDVIGRHISFCYLPEDVASGKPEEALRTAAAAGSHEENGWRLRKDGTRFWANVLTSALHDEKGKLIGFSRLALDLTERIKAEEALQEAHEEMARMTRISTMGELAASIAHEINQPLATIVTNTDACQRLLAHPSPDLGKVREALTDVAEAGMRAGGVISRIRGFMKKGSPQRTKLPIGQVIREALALVDSELKTRRVSVRTTLGNELPDVLGDRVQLQQVLLNLITNGIEALSSVTDGPRILEIRAEAEPSGGVIVSVRDSGAGVDPAIIDRIFDPFFTTKAEGIGIGLSISRSIIESHGGRLSMVANQGRGMTFQFTLPSGAGGAVTS